MRLIKPVILALLICSFVLSPAAAVSGSGVTATSDQLRALFVQRLPKYISWPEGVAPKPGKPFIVAATDAKSLKPYFEAAGVSSNFKLVQWPAEEFHILVLTGASERDVAAILKRTAGRPVLTVGQNPVNLRLGIVVNFHMVRGKLRLQVSPQAAERAGLTISSRLLNIAQVYAGERE